MQTNQTPLNKVTAVPLRLGWTKRVSHRVVGAFDGANLPHHSDVEVVVYTETIQSCGAVRRHVALLQIRLRLLDNRLDEAERSAATHAFDGPLARRARAGHLGDQVFAVVGSHDMPVNARKHRVLCVPKCANQHVDVGGHLRHGYTQRCACSVCLGNMHHLEDCSLTLPSGTAPWTLISLSHLNVPNNKAFLGDWGFGGGRPAAAFPAAAGVCAFAAAVAAAAACACSASSCFFCASASASFVRNSDCCF